MKENISEILKKIAGMIEIDDTPSDEEIKEKRKSLGLVTSPLPEDKDKKVKKPKEEKTKSTAKPKIKPSRKKPSSGKKVTDDTKSDYFKEYMKEYRSDGRVNETSSPKSKYVKKLKKEC